MKKYRCNKTLRDDGSNVCFIKGDIYHGKWYDTGELRLINTNGFEHVVADGPYDNEWLRHFEEVKSDLMKKYRCNKTLVSLSGVTKYLEGKVYPGRRKPYSRSSMIITNEQQVVNEVCNDPANGNWLQYFEEVNDDSKPNVMREYRCIVSIDGELSGKFDLGCVYIERGRNSSQVTLTKKGMNGGSRRVDYATLYQCFEEQGVTITNEQAKSLPVDILKKVAPHLIDRSVKMKAEVIVTESDSDPVCWAGKSGDCIYLDTNKYQFEIKCNKLTVLKKV